MELRPEDQGRRAEVHYVASNTIFYRFEAAKWPKIARKAMQDLHGSPIEVAQKLYVPS